GCRALEIPDARNRYALFIDTPRTARSACYVGAPPNPPRPPVTRPTALESFALPAPSVQRKLLWFARHAEQAIFVGGDDGRVEWANETASRLCGVPLEELV